ncbi:MAG: DUF6520 family protein [Myroides sp.]
MKKNLKQALVPLAVMVFGAAAAFATNAVKQNDKAAADVTHGFYYNSSLPSGKRCVEVEVDCNNISGPICTDASANVVWEFKGLLSCSGELYMNQ